MARKPGPRPMGLLGPALESTAPCRIAGTEQMGGDWMPRTCPKCHAEPPMWVIDMDRERARCITCGQRWVITHFVYTPPPPKRYPRPSWLAPENPPS